MSALEKLATKQLLTRELTKVALRMSDIEDHMGVILDKKHHAKTRKMIEDKKAKSFSLRHPWMTGIPTLGIAPLVAHGRAVDSISRSLAREDKGLRKALLKEQERAHQREMERERIDVEREKARAPVRAAAHLGTAYMIGKSYGR